MARTARSKTRSKPSTRAPAGPSAVRAKRSRAVFIDDDFLLLTRRARQLYHGYAASQPIIDYHCHLPPEQIAQDRRFENLSAIWLAGDHYKWRAMRANGIPERFCTGDASPREKFLAWASTAPRLVRNPLYHWTHLELKRYFGIDTLLDAASAPAIWDRANEQLSEERLSVSGILRMHGVKALCTTDDPVSDLADHRRIAEADAGPGVFPTFRPDKAIFVSEPVPWNAWVERLEQSAQTSISTLDDFLGALRLRHDRFHAAGCRLSDHGLDRCYAEECTESEAASIFAKARRGVAAGPGEGGQFTSYMMQFFGRLDAEKNWTKQLHLGAMRNNSSRMSERLGPDTGFDAIGISPQAAMLARYLDALDRDGVLPKTIVYNANPAENYPIATVLGCFQGDYPGRMQLGSGWWFLDQKQGMEWQIDALSHLGLLSRFVGMVTDSRSFMSFPRHEYFRRVLCNAIGRDVEARELPNDNSLLEPLIRGVCYGNARDLLGLKVS